MKSLFDSDMVRAALVALPPVAAQESLEPPSLERVYVPAGHQRALSLDTTIVVGMRGAGKSLWTAVLLSDLHRHFVAEQAENPALSGLKVRAGFGLDDRNEHFPSERVLAALVANGRDPFLVWQTVVLRHLSSVLDRDFLRAGTWQDAVEWVEANPEEADRLLGDCDTELSQLGMPVLILFDALDRLADDWDMVRKLLGGALRFALYCRARRMIRLKFFLRPDMEEDAEIWNFRDSAKLRHSKVELSWRAADLYGLILMFLANSSDYGEEFRKFIARETGIEWRDRNGLFPVPRRLTNEEAILRPVVEAITGAWMGRSHKRGFAYTWIPTHLADAAGRISPRTFLLAFKHAAEFTAERYQSHATPLHFEGIQQGVTKASGIRIGEIKEDYPWVGPLLEAARDLIVPCEVPDLIGRWTSDKIIQVRSAKKLPPRRFSMDPYRAGNPIALVDDLIELAVLYRAEDGRRVNMPDIFRVGFGIKRKGGVKPPR